METGIFRTRTEFIPKENGGIEGLNPIALDIGYSSVKAYSSNAITAFPSFAKKQEAGFGYVFDAPKGSILYNDKASGDIWMVGKVAEDSTDEGDTTYSENYLYGRDRYQTEMFKVTALTGIGMALSRGKGITKDSPRIVLQTGLPERYMTDADLLKHSLAGHHEYSLKIGNGPWKEFSFDLVENDIYVMPQPKGTLYSVCTGADGKFVPESKQILTKNTTVFDCGFGTLDIFSFGNGVMKGEETYPDLGMRRVLKEAAKMMHESFGVVLDVPHMQGYLESGVVRHFDRIKDEEKDYPVGPSLEIASTAVCNEAMDRVMDILYKSKCDYLIVTGGTGEAWYSQIIDRLKGYPKLTVMKGSENSDLPFIYANVRGYYYALLRRLNSKKEK